MKSKGGGDSANGGISNGGLNGVISEAVDEAESNASAATGVSGNCKSHFADCCVVVRCGGLHIMCMASVLQRWRRMRSCVAALKVRKTEQLVMRSYLLLLVGEVAVFESKVTTGAAKSPKFFLFPKICFHKLGTCLCTRMFFCHVQQPMITGHQVLPLDDGSTSCPPSSATSTHALHPTPSHHQYKPSVEDSARLRWQSPISAIYRIDVNEGSR